jgi:hypothetical protein
MPEPTANSPTEGVRMLRTLADQLEAEGVRVQLLMARLETLFKSFPGLGDWHYGADSVYGLLTPVYVAYVMARDACSEQEAVELLNKVSRYSKKKGSTVTNEEAIYTCGLTIGTALRASPEAYREASLTPGLYSAYRETLLALADFCERVTRAGADAPPKPQGGC